MYTANKKKRQVSNKKKKKKRDFYNRISQNTMFWQAGAKEQEINLAWVYLGQWHHMRFKIFLIGSE